MQNLLDDNTPPTVTAIEVNAAGTVLIVTFSEAIQMRHVDYGGFTITPSGGAATLTYLEQSNIGQIHFTISRVITSDETVTFDYAPGNLRDVANNSIVALDDDAVVNSSAVTTTTTTTT